MSNIWHLLLDKMFVISNKCMKKHRRSRCFLVYPPRVLRLSCTATGCNIKQSQCFAFFFCFCHIIHKRFISQTTKKQSCGLRDCLVYPPRVELGTGRVGGDYSIQLNYEYIASIFYIDYLFLQAKLLAFYLTSV